MHLTKNPLHGLSALALVCAVPLAQTPISTAPVTTTPGMASGSHGLRVDGQGLLGCGDGYVVRFDAAGAHYTPVLGRDAAAVAPLQLGLQSIRRGGTNLACDLVDAPAAVGDTAVFDRSPTIRERYELSDVGVEQSFVFDALPGRGDLVVRCRLGGLGALAVPAADGGLDFVRDGQCLAHMGTVTGIDARGERVRGSLLRDGDVVELSLPAAFVDRAALPLVLDPFLGTPRLFAGSASSESAPHVCWHAQQQRWIGVFERWVSSSQCDVMIRSWSPAGGFGTLLPVASAAGVLATVPRTAYHTGSNRCLVVYEQFTSVLSRHTIEGAVIDGNVATITPFAVASSASGSYQTPDLSGDPTGAGQGVIAYSLFGTVYGIRLRPYTLGATGVPTIGAEVTVTTNSAARPRVSKSSGPVVAIAYEQKPGNYYFATVRAVSRAGALIGNGAAIGSLTGPDRRNPEIDGDGTTFLMAYEYERAVGDRDVWVAQYTWNGSAWGAPVATAAVSEIAGTNETRPTVALLGSKFAVAWEQSTGFLANIVQCRNYARNGCLTCGALVAVPQVGYQQQPALAGSLASGATDEMAMLMFTASPVAFPQTGDVFGCQWNAHTQTAPSVLAAGCGYPMALSLAGAPGIGNPSFGFQVATTDAQATLGAFLIGLGLSTPLTPCGSCQIIQPLANTLVVLSSGAANYGMPLPCAQSLIGLPLQVQAATIGSSQGVCPSLNTLSMSPALGFSIVE